jgi:hypothetical protein
VNFSIGPDTFVVVVLVLIGVILLVVFPVLFTAKTGLARPLAVTRDTAVTMARIANVVVFMFIGIVRELFFI